MMRANLAMTGSFAECADAFVTAVAELRARGDRSPVVALVSSHLARAELQALLHRRLGGVLGVWLLTFRDLADRLGRGAPALAQRREADPLYQRALIARLMTERPQSPFAELARYDGLAAALRRTFEDLEEAGCPRWPDGAPHEGKVGEVAALFELYRAELMRRYFTPQDLLAAAAERAGEFPRIFGARAMHVIGLYDANPLQQRLLDALGATIELRLYAPRVLDPPPLLAALNAPPAAPLTPDASSTHVWSCPTESAEVRAIVREARRLQRAGAPYHRMAVLARHPDVYADLLLDICRRANVPCRVPGGAPPRDSAALRALARLLGLMNSRLRRGEVMALLHAVHLPPDFDAAAARTQPRWDRVSRLARVRQQDDWDRRLSAFAASQDVHLLLEDKTAAAQLRTVATQLLAGLRGLAQARRYSSAATLFTKLARWLISRDEWLDAALASLDRLRLLDDAGLPFSPLVFQTRAGEFIRAVRDEAEDAQGLAVLDFVDARGLRFDVVFIPGCVESMIPSPVRQDPFLLDDERAAFNAALGRAAALPVRADRAREELRLFDLAGRAATRALYLTYPRLDAQEGRARLPSHLLLALAERVTGRALTFDDLPRQAPLVRVFPAGRFAPDEPELALDEDELDLALMERLASSEETGPVRYLQHARPTTFPRVWAKWVHRWARDELGEHDGLCDSDPARAALRAFLAGDKAWAVSDIEDYLLCPRRYLLGKLLNLSSPDDPEQIVSLPSDKRGSLLHKALAAHFDPRRRSEIEAAVRDEYARLAQENLTGGGVLDEVEVERLVESARALVAVTAPEAERRVVEATEFDQTATIVDDGRPVTLSGRLDRVDRGPGGDRFVIDYKTGKAKSALTGGKLNDDDFNGGATLQIPLYLLAYAAAHAEMSLEALSAAYWYLNREQNRPDPRAVNIGGAFMKEKAGILRRVLRDAVEGIEGGRFAPRPDVASAAGNKYCASCGFTVICDPRARALLGIRGRRAGCCPWVDLVGRIDE